MTIKIIRVSDKNTIDYYPDYDFNAEYMAALEKALIVGSCHTTEDKK